MRAIGAAQLKAERRDYVHRMQRRCAHHDRETLSRVLAEMSDLAARFDLDPGCRSCRLALAVHAGAGDEEAKALLVAWSKLPFNPPSSQKFGGKKRK